MNSMNTSLKENDSKSSKTEKKSNNNNNNKPDKKKNYPQVDILNSILTDNFFFFSG